MQSQSVNKFVRTSMTVAGSVNERLEELSIALPAPPTPLGAYVESSDADKSNPTTNKPGRFTNENNQCI